MSLKNAAPESLPQELLTSPIRYMKRSWPFYWISQVNGRYIQVLERRLKPIGLDMPRWRVLMTLYEDEYLSISQIAESSVLKLNTTTKIVQRMVAEGLVTTRQGKDARVTEVTLTEAGEKQRHCALAEAQKILTSGFVNITPKELTTLNSLLEKLFTHLEGA